MKTFVLLLAAVFTSVARAEVFVDMYLADGQTRLQPTDPNEPHVYSDIMVGTRLSVLVSSDVGGYWYGALLLTWDDWDFGTLAPRGEESGPPFLSYNDSALEATGWNPIVMPYVDSLLVGIDLSASADAVPGEWFVLDYRAEKVGVCHVGLYDYDVGMDIVIDALSFHHVPSRDFNRDRIVNFLDFALLASQWRHGVELDPDLPNPVDLDEDGSISTLDMALFSEYWIERTDCNDPNDPNAPCW